MSFFVTLPSNASMDLYDNVVSNYTTSLYQPIKLDGEWQVGVTKVLFRNSIRSSIGYFIVKLDGHAYRIDLSCYDGDYFSTVINSFNEHMNDLLAKLPIAQPFKITASPLKEVDSRNVKIAVLLDDCEVKLEGYLAVLLNEPNLVITKSKPFEKVVKNIKVNTNESMFIYTDIIEDQYVGDTKAKLLDTLSIKGTRDEVVTIEVENPNYVNVNKSEINAINITLRDSTGTLLHFTKFAKFIIKLHFKPKYE